jgi:hypothetical protein
VGPTAVLEEKNSRPRRESNPESCFLKVSFKGQGSSVVTLILQNSTSALIVLNGEMGGACRRHRRDEKTCKILVGKPEGKRPLGRPRHRWEDIIRMDRSKIRWEDVNWMHLAQDRDQWQAVVNTVMNLQVP